ncbi:MAG: hypothetical protein ACI8X5_001935 [Planctomycetota bacterium]|jgi:hypothetical protein
MSQLNQPSPMKIRPLAALLVASTCALQSSAGQSISFYELGSSFTAQDASADGSIVVGASGTLGSYFEWSVSGGVVAIGGSPAGSGVGGVPCISDDGTRIGGTSFNSLSSSNEMSWYDRGTGVWTTLGGNGGSSGSSTSSGWDISGDGMHVVGLGWVNAGEAHGVQWSEGVGTFSLGSTVANQSSRANGVDFDGDTVVGWQDGNGRNAAVWNNGVQTIITTPGGQNVGEASAVSSDGTWVVGNGGSSTSNQGWRWSQASGLEELGSLGLTGGFPPPKGSAVGISADGSVIVGFDRPFGPATTGEGWIWTSPAGLISLDDHFASLGLVVTDNFRFSLPLGVSADGRTFFGLGRSDSSFSTGWVVQIGDCPVPTNFCTSVANSSGIAASITWSGSTSVASNDLVLSARGVPRKASGIFFYGPGEQQIPFGSGFLCVTTTQYRLGVTNSGQAGIAIHNLDITAQSVPSGQIMAGSNWSFQFWFRDVAGGGSQFNTSDGLTIPFCQ